MAVPTPVGFADRSKTEVVAPAYQLSVQVGNPFLKVFQQPPSRRRLADGPADAPDGLLWRARADIGLARLWRVTAADGVAQKVKSSF